MKPFDAQQALDVVIVGAGVVGSAVARECGLRGLRVGVVSGGTLAGSATVAGMGHLVVMDDSPAQFALTAYSQSLWRELPAHLPKAVEYEPCGTIWVAADEEEMAEVRAKQEVYGREGIGWGIGRGMETRILSARELAAAEPNLRAGLAGGRQSFCKEPGTSQSLARVLIVWGVGWWRPCPTCCYPKFPSIEGLEERV